MARVGGNDRHLLESALQRGGFDVVPSTDGVAALEMVCARGPDVIIADLDGNDLDGLVLCRVLRNLSAHATLPVLVLTAAGSHGSLARDVGRLGNVRVIQKPARHAAVVAAASEMIRFVPAVSQRVPSVRRPVRLAGALERGVEGA